jgi:ribosomal protein L22
MTPEDHTPEQKPPRARKPPAKEGAAAEKPAAPPKGSKPTAAEKPPAKKPPAKKPAAKKPAEKQSPPKKPTAKEAPPAEEPSEAKEDDGADDGKPTPAAPRTPSPSAPAARRKVVRAHARYVRTSARKARMVCGQLRGKSVDEARAILAFTSREVARDWSKLLESAVANAENNHELLEDDLFVREAYADEGPTIKRFRPRAQGRATPIRKRTSHLTITLTPKP